MAFMDLLSGAGYPTILGAAIAALDVAAAYRLVTRSQGVERTLAWLFAILALPGVGALTYFALAVQRITPHARRRRLGAAEARRAVSAALPVDGTPPCGHPDDVALLHLVTCLTAIPPAPGTEAVLLTENDHAFERIESALAAARKTIWAEYYLIRRDETGHRFLALLAERARSGVAVRLLYDAFGSIGIDEQHLAAIRLAGGRAQAFLPMNPLRRRWAVHLRNHRKLVTVDGVIGFTGGMNVGDEYSGRGRRLGRQHFRDSHLELRGAGAGALAGVFACDWAFATGEQLPVPAPQAASGGGVVAIVPSGPDQEHNASAMLYFAAVGMARERLCLATPYFVPDDATLRALVAAALRGVEVTLLVPQRSDVLLATAAARATYPELVRAGVRIFEYLPGMLHSKTMALDGRVALVGSANLDFRSFALNYEVGALVVDPGFTARLEDELRRDIAASREVTLATLRRWPATARLQHGLTRLLSPLL
jgi:cardiolipin synthase A/B